MTRPSSRASASHDMGECWSDEEIFLHLEKFISGAPLPSNVTSDVNPYQFKPSNLPEGIWYFCSNVEKDTGHGIWKIKGEACLKFSSLATTGCRTTLQFFEGQAPDRQRTDWEMQEYSITEKGLNHNGCPKVSGVLCRVFNAEVKSPASEVPGKRGLAAPLPTSAPNSDLEKNMDGEKGQPDVAERNPDPPLENLHEFDYIFGCGYLELDDLTDPESCSSTASNLSCMSLSSEEYFDSEALFHNTDEVDKVEQGSLECSSGSNFPITGTHGQDPSAVSQQACGNNRSTQTSQSASSSSSSSHGAVDEGENDGAVSRRKKLKRKYFCFTPFLR